MAKKLPLPSSVELVISRDDDGASRGGDFGTPGSVNHKLATRKVPTFERLDALIDGVPESSRHVPWFVDVSKEPGLDHQQKIMALQALVDTGVISQACRRAGITRLQFGKWLTDDEDFKAAVKLALEDVADDLEEIAILRAKAGSDPLMVTLLKAYRPEKFTEKKQIQHGGDPDNPLMINLKVDMGGVREMLKSRLTAFAKSIGSDGKIRHISAEVMEHAAISPPTDPRL